MVMLSRHKSASSDAWFHAAHRLSVNVDFKHCYYFHDGEYESYSTQEYISVTVSILVMIRCFSFLIRLLHLQNFYVAAQYSEQLAFKVPIVEAVLVELDLQRLARDGAAGEVGNFHPKNERSLKLLKSGLTNRKGFFPLSCLKYDNQGQSSDQDRGRRKVRELLYLSVAYAANTGGVGYANKQIHPQKAKRD